MAYACLVGIFIYFLYVSYEDSISQAFISLQQDAGNCDSVPIAVNGQYLADMEGNWQGTPDYLSSNAVYTVTFSNFEINSVSQYEQMMTSFYSSLSQQGSIAIHHNLAFNLVMMMSFVQYYSVAYPSTENFSAIGFGQLQSISYTAIPAVVFNLEHSRSNTASVHGFCNITGYSSYDQANSIITTAYGDASDYLTSSICMSAMNAGNAGYDATLDGSSIFAPYLDVRSLTISMAINNKLLSLDLLQPISRYQRLFTFNGTEYSLGEYFDPRFPYMSSLFCVANKTSLAVGSHYPTQLCMMTLGSTIALPIFNHYGASSLRPAFCDCSTTIGRSRACQLFNFLPGLLFYNSLSTHHLTSWSIFDGNNTYELLEDLGLIDLMRLVGRFDSYEDLNKAAYNASFMTLSSTNSNCSSSCRQELFDFCTLSNATCSVFVYNSQSGVSQSTSTYKYQLSNGSCSNQMLMTSSTWKKLVESPPVQFTQTYYECYDSESSAMFNALGVASGNTQLFVPLAVFLLLPLLYCSLVVIRQVPPKDEYNKIEKGQVLDILALLVLRLRDGKTRGIKRHGVLLQLVKEMIAAAKEEGGYPDSDDEEEDEGSAPAANSSKRHAHRAPAQYGQPSIVSVSEYGGHGEIDRFSTAPSQQGRNISQSFIDAGHAGLKKNTRLRMAVLTKHLQPIPDASIAPQRGAPRRSFFGSSPFRPSTHPAQRDSLISEAPRETEMGVLGYIFGGKRKPEEQSVSFLDSLIDLTIQLPPPGKPSFWINTTRAKCMLLCAVIGVKVLNQPLPGVVQAGKQDRTLSVQEVEMLLDDLNKLLFECLAAQLPAADSNDVENILLRDSCVSDISMVAPRSRRDLPSFLQARTLSFKLIQVDISHFLNEEESAFFIKLSNIICIHASVELDVEMREVSTSLGNRVGYNVGQRLLTAAQLQSVI
eukprot:scaffold2062_cov181-Ochromonas_danica.AAC.2